MLTARTPRSWLLPPCARGTGVRMTPRRASRLRCRRPRSLPRPAAATACPAWDSKRVHAALRRGGHPRCLVPARGDGAAHDLSDAGQVAGGGRPRADPPRGDGRRANEVLRGHGACRRRHAEPAHREDGAGSARPGRCARPGPGAGEGTALSVPGIAETGARIRRPAHL